MRPAIEPRRSAGGRRAGVVTPVRPIRVRFVGPAGNFNSMAAHGHRVSNGINALGDPGIRSEIAVLDRETFNTRVPRWPGRRRAWVPLITDIDVLVVVKSSTFTRFDAVAGVFKDLCRARGVILVSSPADGPGANAGDTRDRFSEEVADYVFAASETQYKYLCTHRDPATVFRFGVATRPALHAAIPIRDEVRTVVWENPTHYDPNFNPARVGMSHDEYREFEQAIRSFCEARGARLMAFGYWRDSQPDAEWQEMLLGADIAIECKALGGRYTEYQLQKPPTKLQNYLALGLPVVCDPVPSYREIGQAAKVLFADSLDEYQANLTRLFKSRDLRAEISAAAREAVAPFGIEAVSRHHVTSFRKMLERTEY